MEPTDIHGIADWLCRARLQAGAVADCPNAHAVRSEADGYAVQERLHKALETAGLGRLAGYKVGCTTSVMQERLKISNPAYGGIMAANLRETGATFRSSRFLKIGVECEIAMWIASDLRVADAPFDRWTISDHIAACSVGMEIVENRYGDMGTTPTGLLIADDFFQTSCVVGPRIETWSTLDLARVAGSTRVNGELIGSGVGRDVMGHPLEALAWLANRLADRNQALKGGQVVLTGAIVPPYWIESFPTEVSVEVENLGHVTASIA